MLAVRSRNFSTSTKPPGLRPNSRLPPKIRDPLADEAQASLKRWFQSGERGNQFGGGFTVANPPRPLPKRRCSFSTALRRISTPSMGCSSLHLSHGLLL